MLYVCVKPLVDFSNVNSIVWQDSKAQVTAIHLIIGTLQRTHIFGVENRDTLTHKATGVIVLASPICFC